MVHKVNVQEGVHVMVVTAMKDSVISKVDSEPLFQFPVPPNIPAIKLPELPKFPRPKLPSFKFPKFTFGGFSSFF